MAEQQKVRVYELAKALNVPNKSVMDALEKQFNVHLKSHSSSIEQDVADRLVAYFGKGSKASAPKAEEESLPTIIVVDRVRPTRPPQRPPMAQQGQARPAVAGQRPPAGMVAQQGGLPKRPVNTAPPPQLQRSTPLPPGSAVAQARPAVPSVSGATTASSATATVARPVVGSAQAAPSSTAVRPSQALQSQGANGQRPQAGFQGGQRPAGSAQAPSGAMGSARPANSASTTARPTSAPKASTMPPPKPRVPQPIDDRPQPSPSDFLAGMASNHMRQLAPSPNSQKPRPKPPEPETAQAPVPVRGQMAPRPSGGQPRQSYGNTPFPPRAGSGQPQGATPLPGQRPYGPSRLSPDGGAAPSSDAPQRPGYGPNRPAGAGGPSRGGPGAKPGFSRGGQSARPSSGGGRQTRSAKQERERVLREERRTAAAEAAEAAALPTGPIMLPGPMTLKEFSTLSKLKETEIIRHLFMKGMMVTVNQTLDIDVMISVGEAMELDIRKPEVQDLSLVEVASVLDQAPAVTEAEQVLLESRPPVISIMGHVDHGKTSLLDAIRQSRHKIVDTEAGGITQSIGAYTVEQNGKTIVFLDTPGHEAFTSMRMRGAQATDIAILVVAADDGVMPQTIEAINHAKAAKLPIIVAINKVDKEGADPFRTKSALMEHGLIDESLGGETIMVEVSALQKLGIDDLLEMIVLVSDVQNLQANPNTLAEGVIIEAKLDKRKGPVATALVQKGTLKVGENILIGSVGGRVRALINDMGERILEAGPSMPVEILGLDDVPHAGDAFRVIANDKEFKSFLSSEKIKRREERLSQRSRMAGGLTVSMDDENKKELRLVLKADTQGSLEAAIQSIARLATEEVGVNILHTATGDVTEADVMLATASQALIIGFNVKEDGNAGRIAEQENIDIKKFDVIYHMVELVQDRMLGELDAEIHETQAGQAEVRALFNIGKTMVVAGCMVTEGKIVRNAKASVKRAGKVVFEGTVDVLKRFKDDAKEVAQGYECGISFSKYNQVEIGDIITCTVEEKRARTSLKGN